jgi:hypothetical protein
MAAATLNAVLPFAGTAASTPVVSISSYLGGSGFDAVTAVAVDPAGNTYLTGWTESSDFPATGGSAFHGSVDAFVAKFSPANTLVYSVLIGGSGDDRASGIAVDSAGDAYITGTTNSVDFPTVNPYQRWNAGGSDIFVTKVGPTGSLLYSTYLGGSGQDVAGGIAVDAQGEAVIVGSSSSSNFPTFKAFQSHSGGGQDVVISKLNSTGTALLFSTYLGGAGDDHGNAIALDGSGNVYITGDTYSPNFPTIDATQSQIGGGQDAFITKLNSAGSQLLYSTFYGGSGGSAGAPESGSAIAVDAAGEAYVAGTTSSSNFPVVAAYQATFGGGTTDAFVVKLSASGGSAVYATYLGGYGGEYATAIAVDQAGDAYVAGETYSPNFPVVNAVQSAEAGDYDGFFFELGPQGTTLIQSSYYGGSAGDEVLGLALDSSGGLYLGGLTQSMNFPLVNAYQPFNGGEYGGFWVKLKGQSSAAVKTKIGVYRAGHWYIDENADFINEGGPPDQTGNFGISTDIPIWGDWSGTGTIKMGVFRNGTFYLDWNGNGAWDGPTVDRAYAFGLPGDIPVIGDWNGDGRAKVGVYRNGYWYLDANGNGVWDGPSVDRYAWFGMAGDIPVIGNWSGSGTINVGIFRNGTFYLDWNGNGSWDGPTVDRAYAFGLPGDVPLVGDWNGDGRTKVGVFRNGYWYLDANGNGVWDGPSVDRYAWFGVTGDIPVIGDWNGSGTINVGVFRSGAFFLDLNGNGLWDGPSIDVYSQFGQIGDIPVVARW